MNKHKCPICDGDPTRIDTKFKYDKYVCCGLWAWGDHPLVDEATHIARKRAHQAFDPLWKDGHMSRTEAYYVLREMMGLSEKECHMKVMDCKTARSVVFYVNQIKHDLGIT